MAFHADGKDEVCPKGAKRFSNRLLGEKFEGLEIDPCDEILWEKSLERFGKDLRVAQGSLEKVIMM